MHSNIVRHGFILMLLAFVSGLFVQTLPIPRLGLSAHTIGILSGALLIAIGAVWPLFVLSARQQQVMYWAWVYSSYVNWFGCLVGAAAGAGKATPVAAAGAVASDTAEAVVGFLLVSVAIASFIAVGLSIFGLRSRAAVA